jgi:hypothetical protein
MSQGQLQWLGLALVCFVGFSLLLGLWLLGRKSRFVVVFGICMLLSSSVFCLLAVLNPVGLRQQVAAALAPELLFISIFAWICLAQAGALPVRAEAPLPALLNRPRLRSVLRRSPLVLGTVWLSAFVVGMVWPSPAMQPLAHAPVSYLLFKWPLMQTEAFYAALTSAVFLTAAGREVPDRRLRAKNVAFAVAAFCGSMVALNAALNAAVRFWVVDVNLRWALVGLQLRIELILASLSIVAAAVGLALQYKPVLSTTLLQRLQSAWLNAYDRFESLRWRSVAVGKAREVTRASYHLARAAEWLGLPESNKERALEVVELLVAMKNASPEEEALNPLSARELYEVQTEILRNHALASRFTRSASWGFTAAEPQSILSVQHYDALGAALEIIGETQEDSQDPVRPLWYHLAAVSAVDAGLAQRARTEILACQPEYAMAFEAYQKAKVEI